MEKQRLCLLTQVSHLRNHSRTMLGRDLPFILGQQGDVVNKFRTDADPYVSQCLLEILTQKYNRQ